MKDIQISRVSGGGEPERSGVERSGTERSAGSPPPTPKNAGILQTPSTPLNSPPNPEVLEKPQRRRLSADYKLRIVQEADRCTQHGQLSALLRREGLYSSHLKKWRNQRDSGALGALHGKKRGPKKTTPNLMVKQMAQQQREISRLEKRLKRAEAIIEFQKKIAEILDIPLKNPDEEGNNL